MGTIFSFYTRPEILASGIIKVKTVLCHCTLWASTSLYVETSDISALHKYQTHDNVDN